ncbi:plasmid replication protein, CyRepA1 family [Spirulina sp. CCNP1310]|uniref:plasmid replication protein, CyRepA1 family n=1 Tax=Spirulina sp. CCNP1310 TaxID=3110249 RepID=UPI002B1F5906|nr:plasmid replication protein, CyRepA1 family [Spirulina sp. CCNP1310]MEA5420660.1 plasmid replication protein, CyRepA1 family [Spirulina sp. CCNP1310]
MNHLQEWAASGVDAELTGLNVRPLAGSSSYDYLLYAETLPRRNDGRLRDRILSRYQHIEEGGWWCSGIDLLTGKEDLWGCFKPVAPRKTADQRKVIKYEHPPQAETGVFALRVPHRLAEGIAQRYDQPYDPPSQDAVGVASPTENGFWQWLAAHPEIPLCLTEGAKKAGALLTAGFAAIALPGVNGGYRTPRNAAGERIGRSRLIPQLAHLAQNRPIYIVFDQDRKPKTIQAVNGAIRQTAYLLRQQNCEVRVVTWDHHQGKGVDDLIAQGGIAAFEAAYGQALPFESWKATTFTQLTYPAQITLNDRYLPPLAIPPEARLIGLKSPKGTGKTQLLERIVKEAIAQQKWVLVIGHRVRLVEALCQRFGLQYSGVVGSGVVGSGVVGSGVVGSGVVGSGVVVSGVVGSGVVGSGVVGSGVVDSKKTQLTPNPSSLTPNLGYGLCIDSLHPNARASFNAADWRDGVVILDEVEQVLWHGLNSSTCQGNRVAILKSLKTLMQNVLGGQGQVYVADADLSDVSLDYLMALAGVELTPWIVENHWQPTTEAWQVHHYPDPNPDRLLGDLEEHIRHGGRPFVCLSAQKVKSQWGTSNLESYLRQQFPDLNILRLDSESLADATHPAATAMGDLDQVLAQYDVVLTSPCLETGVSIDLRGHFTSVWAIAQGVQAENSVRQALSRVRENLPRYLWVAPFGFNTVGNGSTSIASLLDSGQRLTQVNIRLLQQSDLMTLDDVETGFQAESLLCWAQFAVRVNAAMAHYRDQVLLGLQREGHHILPMAEAVALAPSVEVEESPSLGAAIAEVRDRNYSEECEAIAAAADLTEADYKPLKKQLVKTPEQRRQVRKYDLAQRYGLTVTPELVERDDQDWYPQLRLHYYLTVGRAHLTERDAQLAQAMILQGDGAIFAPDFNRSQLGAKIGVLDLLGIGRLLAQGDRLLRNTDPDLVAMQGVAIANRTFIKAALGIGIPKNASPILIIRRCLEKLGYGVNCVKCEGVLIPGKTKRSRTKRIRVYQIAAPQDSRGAVFTTWLQRDTVPPEGISGEAQSQNDGVIDLPQPYEQLSLFA